jgi:TRAP-type mannitol/chloroaromatic compound transport system permease small subunit
MTMLNLGLLLIFGPIILLMVCLVGSAIIDSWKLSKMMDERDGGIFYRSLEVAAMVFLLLMLSGVMIILIYSPRT